MYSPAPLASPLADQATSPRQTVVGDARVDGDRSGARYPRDVEGGYRGRSAPPRRREATGVTRQARLRRDEGDVALIELGGRDETALIDGVIKDNEIWPDPQAIQLVANGMPPPGAKRSPSARRARASCASTVSSGIPSNWHDTPLGVGHDPFAARSQPDLGDHVGVTVAPPVGVRPPEIDHPRRQTQRLGRGGGDDSVLDAAELSPAPPRAGLSAGLAGTAARPRCVATAH